MKHKVNVRGLVKTFRSEGGDLVPAVRGVSLEVREGDLFAVVGPSGSGKSTLLHCIAGLVKPDEGAILIDGSDVGGVAVHRRGVGMVLQNLGLYGRKSVFENIEFPLRVARIQRQARRSRVDELLGLLRLQEEAGRYPRELSGGQRQRVAIARALARRASLLLLDEPFSDLDAQIRHELRREVRVLHEREGVTTLLVTHDQDDAVAVADRLAVMSDGRLVESDRPAILYANPQHVVTARFLGRPGMSVLAGKIDQNGIVRTGGGDELPVLGLRCPVGPQPGPVWIGIRGEDVEVKSGPGPWRVLVIEEGTMWRTAYLEWKGEKLAGRLNQETHLAPGEMAQVIARGSAHVFDQNTGLRLN